MSPGSRRVPGAAVSPDSRRRRDGQRGGPTVDAPDRRQTLMRQLVKQLEEADATAAQVERLRAQMGASAPLRGNAETFARLSEELRSRAVECEAIGGRIKSMRASAAAATTRSPRRPLHQTPSPVGRISSLFGSPRRAVASPEVLPAVQHTLPAAAAADQDLRRDLAHERSARMVQHRGRLAAEEAAAKAAAQLNQTERQLADEQQQRQALRARVHELEARCSSLGRDAASTNVELARLRGETAETQRMVTAELWRGEQAAASPPRRPADVAPAAPAPAPAPTPAPAPAPAPRAAEPQPDTQAGGAESARRDGERVSRALSRGADAARRWKVWHQLSELRATRQVYFRCKEEEEAAVASAAALQEGLKEECNVLSQRAVQLQTEADQAKEAAASAEQHAQRALAAAEDERVRLAHDLQEAERSGAERQVEELWQLRQRNDELSESASRLRQDLESVTAGGDKLAAELSVTRSACAVAEEAEARATADLTMAREEIASLTDELERAKENERRLCATVVALESSLQESEASAAAQQTLERENESLRERLRCVMQECEALAEKAQTSGGTGGADSDTELKLLEAGERAAAAEREAAECRDRVCRLTEECAAAHEEALSLAQQLQAAPPPAPRRLPPATQRLIAAALQRSHDHRLMHQTLRRLQCAVPPRSVRREPSLMSSVREGPTSPLVRIATGLACSALSRQRIASPSSARRAASPSGSSRILTPRSDEASQRLAASFRSGQAPQLHSPPFRSPRSPTQDDE
eukprot:TRINITY_DN24460_c0_g1_i1.p1 TRINITY_DN24460_c0_g1~~TRINITY_DN24460_c0_g1_i1.p1  ORF type:complete len:830 (+),score=275.95 TRINITY_DN24460_c0_g1_i1:208-2490(+)